IEELEKRWRVDWRLGDVDAERIERMRRASHWKRRLIVRQCQWLDKNPAATKSTTLVSETRYPTHTIKCANRAVLRLRLRNKLPAVARHAPAIARAMIVVRSVRSSMPGRE